MAGMVAIRVAVQRRASVPRTHGVRSACDSERPTTVTRGQSWSLDGDRRGSAQASFVLVRVLETSPKLVVRGRVELPTFRFSGGRSYRLSYLTWLGPQ